MRGTDGAISVDVVGGTGTYTYAWTHGATEEDLENLGAGSYSLQITDESGCSILLEAVIGQPEALEIRLEAEDVACHGDETGAISSEVTGGTSDYSYSWSTGSVSNNLSEIPAGEYTLSITDTNGCEAEESMLVLEPEIPLEADMIKEDVSCHGGRDGMLTVDAFGGTPPYTFSLNGSPFSSTRTFIGLLAGDYTVRIRDAEGCEFISESTNISEPDPLELDLGENRVIDFGRTLELDPLFTGHVGSVSFDWSPKDSSILSCFTCRYPELTIDDQTQISLIITDENGCTAEDFLLIGVQRDRRVFVPSGFTPNGDGNNDRLLVHGEAGTIVTLFRVFDRWGELLYENGDFEVNDPDQGWDGTFRTKAASGGVYIWYLEVEYIDGAVESFKGHVTLAR